MAVLRTIGTWTGILALIVGVVGVVLTELVSLLAALLGGLLRALPGGSDPAYRNVKRRR